ncbi:MAG: carboxymuconolactone decarboxylase family protein [Vicinamibacteria bacterium]|nr:carboxymuconolactone decarboxylase family protein [Vicinamibacteria bacterium]
MNSEYKMTQPLVSLDAASPEARPVLERAQRALGFIPNMYAGMVHSPGLLETYLDGYERFRKSSGFTPAEQEVVFLAVSVGNGCDYCVSAHSMLAEKVSQVPAAVLLALREGREVPDPKLGALARFTETLRATRGLPSKADVEAFLAAGYQERHVLEIVLALAVKTLSNYANHLFHTPLDGVFAGHEWKSRA